MIRVSLQTKILTLIISLVVFITIMLTGIYAYLEAEEIEKNMGETALRVATTISLIPAVKGAFTAEKPSLIIQPLAESIRVMVGAEFIVVGNIDSVRYSHPNPEKIGKKMVGGDNDLALIEGQFYTSKAVGSLGPSLRGKAPIFDHDGNIIGIVSVGFLIEDIQSVVVKKVMQISGLAVVILFFGILGGTLLARNIRKDTYGLEPHEIAALYRERHAILYSIKEGIIAIDETGVITMINQSAKKMLNISEDSLNKPMDEVLENKELHEILLTVEERQDMEMTLRDRVVIINHTPIMEEEKVVGVVVTFRDKTEVQKMLNTIFEIRKYSEEMRAQTHEFMNKLYVLSGLLQLGHYKDAVKMIQSETLQHESQNRVLFDQIHDPTVQAILLGKISIASEKKINFIIDENSSLAPLLSHIESTDIITIVGNLIDNAFEAVTHQRERLVTFFTTDMGHDIVLEIADNGPGILDEQLELVFHKGFSTKGSKNRGYGLANVKKIIEHLDGSVEIQNEKNGGVVFTVFIPKR